MMKLFYRMQIIEVYGSSLIVTVFEHFSMLLLEMYTLPVTLWVLE